MLSTIYDQTAPSDEEWAAGCVEEMEQNKRSIHWFRGEINDDRLCFEAGADPVWKQNKKKQLSFCGSWAA